MVSNFKGVCRNPSNALRFMRLSSRCKYDIHFNSRGVYAIANVPTQLNKTVQRAFAKEFYKQAPHAVQIWKWQKTSKKKVVCEGPNDLDDNQNQKM